MHLNRDECEMRKKYLMGVRGVTRIKSWQGYFFIPMATYKEYSISLLNFRYAIFDFLKHRLFISDIFRYFLAVKYQITKQANGTWNT